MAVRHAEGEVAGDLLVDLMVEEEDGFLRSALAVVKSLVFPTLVGGTYTSCEPVLSC